MALSNPPPDYFQTPKKSDIVNENHIELSFVKSVSIRVSSNKALDQEPDWESES